MDNIATSSLWKTFTAARIYVRQLTRTFSTAQLLDTQKGSSLSSLWHIGHIVYSHDRFLYEATGLTSPLPSYFEQKFAPGVSPETWTTTPDIDDVFYHFDEQLPRLEHDLRAGLFSSYETIEIAPGYQLETVSDAMSFNLAHEGFHFAAVIGTANTIFDAANAK